MQRISVVIPTYNNAEFLIKAIESVLDQKYEAYEIIVVDDGSTDDTQSVIKPYMAKISYFLKSNTGVASARNVGINNAKGNYIAFLDSDDLWSNNKLKETVKVIEQYPDVGLIHTGAYRVNRNGRILGSIINKDWGPKLYFKLLQGFSIYNSSVVVKKECFENCGYFYEYYQAKAGAEDWDRWIRIAKRYDNKTFIYNANAAAAAANTAVAINAEAPDFALGEGLAVPAGPADGDGSHEAGHCDRSPQLYS